MHFCIFAHTEDNRPKPKEKPWVDLARDLTRHRITTIDKNASGRISIPLISLATYKEGTLRAVNNVLTVNAAALDIDNIDPDVWKQIETNLVNSKVSCFWYTTYNSTPTNYKVRLIIELTRPVTVTEWNRIFPLLCGLFHADLKTRDASRMFFGPYVRSLEGHFSNIVVGLPFDVEALLNKATTSVVGTTINDVDGFSSVDLPPPANIVVTRDMLTLLSRKLLKRSNANDQIAGRMIRSIRDGEAFTEEGYRDTAVFQYIVTALVNEWPGVDTKAMMELAVPSLETSGGVTPEGFRNKLERAKINRQEYLQRIALEKKQKHERSLAKVQLARELVGVDSYYVDESLPSLSCEAMVSRNKFNVPIQQAKIVQHQSDYYFWCNGTYQGPIQKSAFVSAAVKYLSPFEEIEKELFDSNGNLQEVNIDNFINHHGQFVKEVIFALGSNETSLTNDALVLPYFPPLKAKTEYSWRIEAWLYYLFGGCASPKGPALARVQWAKQSVLLPAILFVGKTGAGKGLFAEMLNHTYEIPAQVRSLDLLYAQGTENDVYPIMVADEEFPQCTSAQLRDGITRYNHTLKKKYQNLRRVRGYIRHLFLLNDADRIKTFDVGVEAQRASAERFMFVPVTAECRSYLEFLCQSDQRIQPGELQAHVEWLREQGTVAQNKGRFAVEVPADNKSFAETFYRQKGRFEVLNVLCHYLCKRSYPAGWKERYDGWPIEVVGSGEATEVRIRTTPFYGYCEDKIRDNNKASLVRILKSIAEPKADKNGRYWVLETEHLFRWSEIAMEYSDEEIKEALTQTTESKVDSAVGLEGREWN